jgi:molybdopterin/thiamine biosynthesis adenylyltransferase
VSATAKRWYERDEERLAWELEEFERHSLPVELSTDDHGRLVITTEVTFRGEPAAITVTYPHSYPYFAPDVSGEALLLDRHQHPVSLNYCLLEDPARDWHWGRSAGKLIGKNLRNLLSDSAKGQEAIRLGEARMAEPEGAFFAHRPDAVVLVAEPFLSNELYAASGAMTIRRSHGAVRVLVEAKGQGKIDDELLERYPKAQGDVQGRWVSIWGRPTAEDFPKRLLETLREAEPESFIKLDRQLQRAKRLPMTTGIVGLTFLEQGPTRNEQRRNWMFFELIKKRGYEATLRRWPTETQALSRAERARRLPEMNGLDQARIVVIGAGSLGAPLALELAKAGAGRLDIFDCDRYDLNNSVRHVLGDEHAGEGKAKAVADYCSRLNPFGDFHGHPLCLGESQEAESLLDELLSEATLVVDTTGALTVAHYLAARTRAANLPLIVAGLTAGSYGADLFVVAPDGPSIDAFLEAQAAEDGPIPPPAAGEVSEETPIGCRHPAFTGAGFEVTELAAIAARKAIQTTSLTGYPPSSSNWIVLNFRGDGPHYQEGRLEADAESTA